eukprot:scaffold747_cov308-Prasinococcus_capsulatus_cf.AAC.2
MPSVPAWSWAAPWSACGVVGSGTVWQVDGVRSRQGERYGASASVPRACHGTTYRASTCACLFVAYKHALALQVDADLAMHGGSRLPESPRVRVTLGRPTSSRRSQGYPGWQTSTCEPSSNRGDR